MSGTESKQWTPLDEVFVYRLKTLHSILAPLVHDSLKAKLASDKSFKKRYEEWVSKQGWLLDDARLLNVANQSAYIMVNRIIFYKALEKKKKIPPLTKAENVSALLKKLRLCFAEALKIDYRAVFQRDPIFDEIPLTPEVANILNIIIEEISEYNLSDIKRDVIGLLYEKLIPVDERHKLGQFYTPQRIVELIVKMCVKSPGDKILDPACGSGGFLVEAYNHLLRLKGESKVTEQIHQELLGQIWGIDINKFPAQLATINLAKQNLESQSDLVNVIVSDFFDIRKPTQKVLAPWSAITPDGEKEILEIPLFDTVAANPPYTRQEEIEEETFGKEYKNQLFKVICDDFREIKLSKRAGIYTYFFVHGARFLKEKGRLGFVTLRSWLDVGYGKDIQRFFLDNFKIKTIIESKMERWFPDAQMLPCVSIFERCSAKYERENNHVKFVLVKAPLAQFTMSNEKNIPQVANRVTDSIERLVNLIENAEKLFNFREISYLGKSLLIHEDDMLRIVMVKQRHLREDGKWGKYLRAPSVFFKILQKGKSLLTSLENSEVAEVRYGIKTGANVFFYLPNRNFTIKEEGRYYALTNKKNSKIRYRIEKEYLKPVIVKIKPHKAITIKRKDGLCLFAPEQRAELHMNKRKVLDYINFGESRGFHERPTCASRNPWYDLGERESFTMICPTIFWNRFVVFYNSLGVLANNAFYEIKPRNEELGKALCAILNSTLTALFVELSGNYIENRDKTISNQIRGYEIRQLPILDLTKLDNETIKKLEQVFEKLRLREMKTIPEEVLKQDRRELDDVLFDLLGLTADERGEVYDGIVELVEMRMRKIERWSPFPSEIVYGEAMTARELEEIVELLQLSKIGQITDEQKTALGQRAGRIVRDIVYELIKLNHEPMHTKEITSKLLNIEDKVLKLAGYFDVIRRVMGGKIQPSQVIRDLLDIWRDKPEGIEKTITKLLATDSRLLKISQRLIGLSEWSPNQLFQIYVRLASEFRLTDPEKKEDFINEAIRLLESGETEFPNKEALIKTLRRL